MLIMVELIIFTSGGEGPEARNAHRTGPYHSPYGQTPSPRARPGAAAVGGSVALGLSRFSASGRRARAAARPL